MTDLTARELMNTILRSLAETRATFRKTAEPSTDDSATLQPKKNEADPVSETADQGRR
jgi:hypothetical protein